MFEIKGNHVHLTEDCEFGKKGDDLGHLADVLCNHVAAVDPDNPADSLVYRVARAIADAHAAELARERVIHETAFQAMRSVYEATIERLKSPPPDDVEAIEAAAQRLAAKKRTERLVEQRADAILAKEKETAKDAK